MNLPRVSIIVNTYNRADSLRRTLQSLEQLDYPSFEVVVVNGPSDDHTGDVLTEFAGRIKCGSCEERNISISRNVGLRLAAGTIVAFIDDDAYPDPAWLDELVNAFDDGEVAAAGGPVWNYTGTDIQAWTNLADRLGNASVRWEPTPDLVPYITSPASNVTHYTIGTNSLFRRDVLVGIGGFDEEFEYYLDETDVCRRLIDIGFVVRPLDSGFVYHKFLPSYVRDRPDFVKDHYNILKSKFYFALKHGADRRSFAEICEDASAFIRQRTEHVERGVAAGHLSVKDQRKFEIDVHRASTEAFDAFLRAAPRTRPVDWFNSVRQPFLPFPTLRAGADKLHICFLTQEYPPAHLNGIGRVVHSLARGLADQGHVVRVLTGSSGYPTVDLEERVWVHRLPTGHHPAPAGMEVPAHIWDFSATLAHELGRIDALRQIDVVQAPNWDSQGIAIELDGRHRTVIGLYTPLATLIRTDPVFAKAFAEDDALLHQLHELEPWCFTHADGILASTPSIVDEVEREYAVSLAAVPTGFVPHGLPDSSMGVRPALRPGKINVLFVGRLEARKGADVLLKAVPLLAPECPDLVVTVVGDTSPLGPDGRTLRAAFEADNPLLRGRVQFAGLAGDELLWRLYAGCDIVVIPSRFESFGLPAVEAMMFGKPVVASDVGGLSTVVADGATGLLVPVDDPVALAHAIGTLADDESLRRRYGQAGRASYEQHYSVDSMASGAAEFYRRLVATTPTRNHEETTVLSGVTNR